MMNSGISAVVRQGDWQAQQVRGLPEQIAGALADRHERTRRRAGLAAANIQLREWRERHDTAAHRLKLDADEEALRTWAARRAKDCERLVSGEPDLMEAYALLHTYCGGFAIKPAPIKKGATPHGAVERMKDPQWWRRRMRTQHARECEQRARELGLVGSPGHVYVTREALTRWADRQRVNAKMLDETVAVDEAGGREITLTQAVAASVSNPALRRLELMTRLRGFEEVARERGDEGLFITWTAPAKKHARHSRTGRILPGAALTPRDVSQYLMDQWQKARSALDRRGVHVYGVRVSEPHQDGTPHMHLMLFCAAGDVGTVRAILKGYALEHDADEPGARRNRFKAVAIDPERGTAAGYCAKYVAKNVDGFSLAHGEALGTDGDKCALEPSETAVRVRAWASLWGIRQFQFIGSPAVTVWRDLRRLDGSIAHISAEAERARAAADAGDWQAFVAAMRGRPVRLAPKVDGYNRYGEFRVRYVLLTAGGVIDAHPVRWTLQWKPKAEKHDTGGVPADLMRPRDGYAGRIELPSVEAPFKPGASVAFDRSLVGSLRASAAPWTCDNNYTGGRHDDVAGGNVRGYGRNDCGRGDSVRYSGSGPGSGRGALQ